MTGKVALYSAIDGHLTHYEVDVENAALSRGRTVAAPGTTVTQVNADGRLEFVRQYEVEAGAGGIHYWMGIVEVS